MLHVSEEFKIHLALEQLVWGSDTVTLSGSGLVSLGLYGEVSGTAGSDGEGPVAAPDSGHPV